jgi:hypothetical protein
LIPGHGFAINRIKGDDRDPSNTNTQDKTMTHTNLVTLLSNLSPTKFTFAVDWTGTSDVKVSVRRAGWPVHNSYVADVLVTTRGWMFNKTYTDVNDVVTNLNKMFDLVEGM